MTVHYWAKFAEQNAQGSIIEALDDPKFFGTTGERYNVSKVLSVFTARELAKLPAVTSGKVNVSSANPGKLPCRDSEFVRLTCLQDYASQGSVTRWDQPLRPL